MMSRTRYYRLLLCLTFAAHSGLAADAMSASPPVAWQEPVVVATGSAYAGPWRMNESKFHYVDDATPVVGDDGVVVTAWVDNERQDVFLQRYDQRGIAQFEEPTNVSFSPTVFSWLPRVLMTADEKVYVLWQEIVFSGGSHGGEIFFAQSADGGEHFSAPVNLSNTTAGAGKGRLTEQQWDNGSFDFALGPKGDIVVVWTEYEGALRSRRSQDGGRSFSDPIQISGTEQQPARAPSLAFGLDGTVYLAWAVGEDPGADIHITRSEDRGRSFLPEHVVYESGGRSDVPRLAVDAEGSVHLVYAESPSGLLGQSHVRYTLLDGAGEAYSRPRVLSRRSDGNWGGHAPAIDLDRQGRLYVIWEHQSVAEQRARGLGFAFSEDGGQSFTEPDIIPGSRDPKGGINGSLQGRLGNKLSVNQHGTIAASNSHFLLGERSRVLLIRGQANTAEAESQVAGTRLP